MGKTANQLKLWLKTNIFEKLEKPLHLSNQLR